MHNAIPNPVPQQPQRDPRRDSQRKPGQSNRKPDTSERRQNKMLPWLVIGGAAALGVSMLAAILMLLGVLYLSQPRIPGGVSVAGVEIGGETVNDAHEMLTGALIEYRQQLTARDGERTWTLGLGDLGISIDWDATVTAAQGSRTNSDIAPVYRVDLAQAQQGLIALSAETNIAAVPGDPPQMGRALEIPVLLDRLNQDLNGEIGDGVLDLAMMTVEPPPYDPVQHYEGETIVHIVEPGQELALIARQYGVGLQDILDFNDITNPDIIWVGQEILIPAAGEYQPDAASAPPAPTQTGKAIVVSTQEQRIYAYENGQLIRSHLTSTGRTQTPTVLGDYNIYVKYVADDMQGADYFLPDVPYTMYFYQGYGIHGTYWHNSFGRPMSHGCVNLPVDEAEWFFNWAEVGTLVRVI